ncbi:MAG: TolB family protein, partial [Bacteroidota bacterium]
MNKKVCSLLSVLAFVFSLTIKGQNACDVIDLEPTDPIVVWSPDKQKYLVNKKDTAGIYQIYTGNKGSTQLTCVSVNGPWGLVRHTNIRHKMQVNWHPSGKWILFVLEREIYNELLLKGTPEGEKLLEGWLQCGLWMDMYAMTTDGSNWYHLATTTNGVVGPVFTPDGKTAVWANAVGGDLSVDVFGKWELMRSDFVEVGGVPALVNSVNINPPGTRWIEPGNFHPNGRQVMITADIGIVNAEGQDQYILDIYTGAYVNLTNSPTIWDEHGIISPDGKKIIFMSSYPYRADSLANTTLFLKTEFMLMNADGTGLQQLTHYNDPTYPEYSGGGVAACGYWSDDGSEFHCWELKFPYYNYWIIRFDGLCGNEPVSTSIDEKNSDALFSGYPN